MRSKLTLSLLLVSGLVLSPAVSAAQAADQQRITHQLLSELDVRTVLRELQQEAATELRRSILEALRFRTPSRAGASPNSGV